MTAAAPAPVRAVSLDCPRCGAAIPLRTYGWAETVACAACGSLLAPEDERLRILDTAKQRFDQGNFTLPLGARGELDGSPWEIIGAQVKEVVVEGTAYRWREYVLFHPVNGFRYLTEYDGHWSWVRTLHGVPTVSGGAQPVARIDGGTFKHFQSATARTVMVFGEFPWEARVGDYVNTRDYVDPPRMLSAEGSAEETTWSLGTYVEHAVVAKAFGVELPEPVGVFAHQPSPHGKRLRRMWGTFLLAVAALVAITLGLRTMAVNERVLSYEGDFRTERPFGSGSAEAPAFVTDTFVLRGHTSNVVIGTEATVHNSWLYVNYALINLGTGQAWELGREVSYYEGVEDGERWSEGDSGDEAVLAGIPSGTYYLRVAIEGPRDPFPIRYRIRVTRDRPSWLWPFVALGLLVVPLIGTWVKWSHFENLRWLQSDHPPGSGSDGDDSDGDD